MFLSRPTEKAHILGLFTVLDTKLEKLLDVFLSDALSATEYAAKKNRLVSEKATLTGKISDIETREASWLEPAREFVLSLNQAANLLSQNNLFEMTAFLKNIGANHILQNRQFVFEPKMQYVLTAERSEAGISNLQFPKWCPGWDSFSPDAKRLLRSQGPSLPLAPRALRVPFEPHQYKIQNPLSQG